MPFLVEHRLYLHNADELKPQFVVLLRDLRGQRGVFDALGGGAVCGSPLRELVGTRRFSSSNQARKSLSLMLDCLLDKVRAPRDNRNREVPGSSWPRALASVVY
jgi:hypothetical protein